MHSCAHTLATGNAPCGLGQTARTVPHLPRHTQRNAGRRAAAHQLAHRVGRRRRAALGKPRHGVGVVGGRATGTAAAVPNTRKRSPVCRALRLCIQCGHRDREQRLRKKACTGPHICAETGLTAQLCGQLPHTDHGSAQDCAHQVALRGCARTMGAPEPRRFGADEWRRRSEQVGLAREEMDALVLNFLVVEGYEDAARRFVAEARLAAPAALADMHGRREIQDAIHRGDVEDAIRKINELDPQLLDERRGIHFMLLRLELIERLRRKQGREEDVGEILEFAGEHLAPRAGEDAGFLEDLESTMALLCFSGENVVPALRPLLEMSLRKRVAAGVNEAILESQGHVQESRIKTLLLFYTETEGAWSLNRMVFPWVVETTTVEKWSRGMDERFPVDSDPRFRRLRKRGRVVLDERFFSVLEPGFSEERGCCFLMGGG
ncbi:hypothetical protein PMAC_002703 [Pneumocystis sp. 'macacae']|nr:hypothetical protein PMAC_002703 [Pneumocystis sp. 'macacae']